MLLGVISFVMKMFKFLIVFDVLLIEIYWLILYGWKMISIILVVMLFNVFCRVRLIVSVLVFRIVMRLVV